VGGLTELESKKCQAAHGVASVEGESSKGFLLKDRGRGPPPQVLKSFIQGNRPKSFGNCFLKKSGRIIFLNKNK